MRNGSLRKGYAVGLASAVTVLVAACGGSESLGLSGAEREALESDPRVVRLTRIGERADTLLVPSTHLQYSLRALGESVSDRTVESMRCSSTRCSGSEGTDLSVEDLFDPSVDTYLTDVELGSREGFDTARSQVRFSLEDSIPDTEITRFPAGTEYGLWGEYGYAALAVVEGGFRGTFEGISFEGDVAVATAAAVGDATGVNPYGTGSAAWHGIAEAASTRTFERREGTAVISIPDLSRPRVSVAVEIEGYAIGSAAWTDMLVSNGRYGAGRVGTDHLVGDFHGPGHQETYGVFDTGAYVGAFGAKRAEGG